jgi:GT2 family glycosyltransferase
MKPSLSVVIPNFNGKRLLEENIPPLKKALELCGAEYEIIIPDDASTDSSITFLEETYPEIRIISSSINRGFAPNANSGIAACTRDLVFLMNTDIRITGDYFSPQFAYFDDPSTFGVMGQVIGLNDDRVLDTAKYPQLALSGLRTTKNFHIEPEDPAFSVPTLFLTGANALMDRKKLMILGGFDEAFAPFYSEDVELSLRAWRLGWKCRYEPRSVCRHPISATIAQFNKKRGVRITAVANRNYLHYLHLGWLGQIGWSIYTLLRVLFSWLVLDFDYYMIFRLYLQKSSRLPVSRKKFLTAAEQAGLKKPLSLGTAIKNIRDLLKGKRIVLK